MLHPWHAAHYYAPPPPPPPPPPPAAAHKVYILDCKSCGTFLTNRGMKAVLLLRPSVALYSSDALPINCSAYTSNPHALPPATPTCPSASANPLRTCECLTQTLCCHGCGNSIGYMIVAPCSRCTSSINPRSTNGHRYVFHSNEIAGTERHYIENEPGIILPQTAAPPASSNSPHDPSMSALPLGPTNRFQSPPTFFYHSRPLAVAAHPHYLPTPPLDPEDISSSSSGPSSPAPDSLPSLHDGRRLSLEYPLSLPQPSRPIFHYEQIHTHYSHSHDRASLTASSDSSTSSMPPLIQPSHSFGLPAEHMESPALPPLVAGDVLYWHHLVRHGELAGVIEDSRARRRSLAIKSGKTRILFDR